jgi:hypothetical protein
MRLWCLVGGGPHADGASVRQGHGTAGGTLTHLGCSSSSRVPYRTWHPAMRWWLQGPPLPQQR